MDVKRKKFGFTPLETKVSNRGSNRFLTGFTLAEILTVLGIIALLVGLLLPALGWVRRIARETKQKAQLTTIGLTLTAFKNDDGDYPPSDGYYYPPFPPGPSDYCGAQKLAEALLGWDLLGVHPKSDFRSNGVNDDGVYVYDTTDPILFGQRRGPYLELATTNAFKLGDLFGWGAGDTGVLHPDTFVLCDVFGIPERRITLANGKTVAPGTPILYYRANTSSKSLRETGDLTGDGIYDFRDNSYLLILGKIKDGTEHKLCSFLFFYGNPAKDPPKIGYIQDPKVTAMPWPYRSDSYILISAGADGEYGTGDDITNFGN